MMGNQELVALIRRRHQVIACEDGPDCCATCTSCGPLMHGVCEVLVLAASLEATAAEVSDLRGQLAMLRSLPRI